MCRREAWQICGTYHTSVFGLCDSSSLGHIAGCHPMYWSREGITDEEALQTKCCTASIVASDSRVGQCSMALCAELRSSSKNEHDPSLLWHAFCLVTRRTQKVVRRCDTVGWFRRYDNLKACVYVCMYVDLVPLRRSTVRYRGVILVPFLWESRLC